MINYLYTTEQQYSTDILVARNTTDTLTNKTLTSPTVTGDLTVDTNTLFVDSSNNRVGIGTVTPTTALDVSGTVTATAFAGPLTGNVTGNVSGSAATVTGASQTAITGLGTITSGTIDGGSTTRNALIEVRSDTAANWTSANSTLSTGEIGFETDTGKFKIGTGSTAWTSLAYSFNATISTSQPSGGNDGDVWMVYS